MKSNRKYYTLKYRLRKVQNYEWSDEYLKKAQIMMDLHNYDKAIEYLREAQKLDELNHEIFEKKGLCFYFKVN